MPNTKDFDVALSFSGDHRAYVTEVAAGLGRRGYRVFYDHNSRADLIGQELISYLQGVYSYRTHSVAAFISDGWVNRPWPRHERESSLAHALIATGGDAQFLLPFRFDDTHVLGLQPTVGYEDLRTLGPGERRWRQDPQYRHPRHVAELIEGVLVRRGIGGSPADDEGDYTDAVRTRLVWLDERGGVLAEGHVPTNEYSDGETEVFPDEQEPGGPIPGRYLLLREQLGASLDPNDPIPVFLHEAYQAYEKSWVQPYDESGGETAAVEQTRRHVHSLVEAEIAHGAVPIGPTFTRSIPTPHGTAVVGICVLARPQQPNY